jgi:hypothetical protein
MFSPRNTESPNPFRPALQYLVSAGRPRLNHRPSSSSRSIDSDGEEVPSRMLPSDPNELRPASIPSSNIPGSASPLRRRSNSDLNSDSDNDDWGDNPSSTRQPFLIQDAAKLTGWRRLIYGGGAGQFFFNTPLGWQLYIGTLVLWLGGCQIGLTIMNRIILWSGYLQENYTSHTKLIPLIAGVYKFPYPLTTTLIEMLITHGYLLLSAYITRWVSPWLNSAGLSGAIAPSRPLQSPLSTGFCGGKIGGFWDGFSRWTAYQTGGIAGGGLFEFDLQIAKTVLPCAVIFVAKVVLSNISFAYAQIQVYVLARIAIVPLALFFTYFLGGTKHSVTTISSAFTATITLAIATDPQPSVRITWESVVAGVISSIFVALYPVQLQRTYKSLVASLVPQGDLLGSLPSSNTSPDFSGSKEEARAYWRLLHYTSLISILLFFPIVVLSGELAIIWRNCYVLDVFFHWLMVLCGGTGSWAVFWATMALTRATSPLTTAFLFVPRAAFLLPVMARFKMSPYAWVGIVMCWVSCTWFLMTRRKDGRELGWLR